VSDTVGSGGTSGEDVVNYIIFFFHFRIESSFFSREIKKGRDDTTVRKYTLSAFYDKCISILKQRIYRLPVQNDAYILNY
jgi:hypothetical protein